MSKSGILFFLLTVTFLVSLAGCKRKEDSKGDSIHSSRQDASEIVAKVGDAVITLEDFEQQLGMQNPLVRSRYKSLDQKKKFLESLVEREAMVQEAKRLGLDKDPEVLHGLNRLLARQLVNKEFNEKRIKQIEITDEQIERYYQENNSRYHVPDKVRVHLIHFKAAATDPKARKQAREKAQGTLKKLRAIQKDLQAFLKLARKTSEDDATKRIGGDTHYKTHAQLTESYGKAFADVVFSMQEPNSLSSVVATKDGFYIIRFAGKQAAIDFPLEKVKGQIRTTLFARTRADAYKSFVEEVKDRVGIKLFEDVAIKAKVETKGESPFMHPRKAKVPAPKVEKLRQPKLPGEKPEALQRAPKDVTAGDDSNEPAR